jgi:hypothetical protein
MNKLLAILSELDNESSEDFIGACAAQYRNLIGVPRLVVKNSVRLKTKKIKTLFARSKDHYSNIDKKYHDLISKQDVKAFLESIEYSVMFDLCRVSFLEEDELFNFVPSKFKKIFKLNQRNDEKNNFTQSNIKHLDDSGYITTRIIFDKLNSVWLSKWNDPETYLNEYDEQIINNILNA